VWENAVPGWVVNTMTDVATPWGMVESTSEEWVSVRRFMDLLEEAGPVVVVVGWGLYVDIENDPF
jgi:hypothetical protein